jgi:hypothetical protein
MLSEANKVQESRRIPLMLLKHETHETHEKNDQRKAEAILFDGAHRELRYPLWKLFGYLENLKRRSDRRQPHLCFAATPLKPLTKIEFPTFCLP